MFQFFRELAHAWLRMTLKPRVGVGMGVGIEMTV
jgi:hypothetical protein